MIFKQKYAKGKDKRQTEIQTEQGGVRKCKFLKAVNVIVAEQPVLQSCDKSKRKNKNGRTLTLRENKSYLILLICLFVISFLNTDVEPMQLLNWYVFIELCRQQLLLKLKYLVIMQDFLRGCFCITFSLFYLFSYFNSLISCSIIFKFLFWVS